MARLFGIAGKASGKMGSMVFRVRDGQQVVSSYNPIVKNPRSSEQTDQRAKFKLMSQLSAIFANVIAIPTTDGKSGRNIFTKKNFPLVEVSAGEAKIHLENLQLTNGNIRPVDYTLARSAGGITVATKGNLEGLYNQVIAIMATVNAAGQISIVGSQSLTKSTEAGVDTFSGQFTGEVATADVVAYIYGVNAKSAKARDRFDNIEGDAATFMASLVSSRTIGVADAALTASLGVTMAANASSADSSNFNGAAVTVSTVGSGSVVGAGRYLLGTTCTLVATPAQGAEFVGYYVGGNQVSANARYEFTVTGDVAVEARFTTAQATLAVSASPAEGGSVTGGGTFNAGTNVTVVATPNQDYHFVGWYDNGTQVSTSASYTFQLMGNTSLEGRFAADAPAGEVTITVTPTEEHPSDLTIVGQGTATAGETHACIVDWNYGGYNGHFVGWFAAPYVPGTSQALSTQVRYEFTPVDDTDLVAAFAQNE